MSHIWMSDVAHLNLRCCTFECDTLHVRTRPRMNEPCRTCECIVFQRWINHVARMDASLSHIWMSHVAHMKNLGWLGRKCVCVRACVCMCMCMCMCMCTCTCIVCVCVCVFWYVYICVCVCVYVCVYTCVCVCTCVYVCVCIFWMC